MENINSMPFVPQMPIFGKVADLASTAAMTRDELQAYEDSVNAYRTTLAALEYSMEKGMEEGMQKGMEEGMQKGMEKGMEKGILKTALNMKKEGLSTSLIAKCTGLTEEQILAL